MCNYIFYMYIYSATHGTWLKLVYKFRCNRENPLLHRLQRQNILLFKNCCVKSCNLARLGGAKSYSDTKKKKKKIQNFATVHIFYSMKSNQALSTSYDYMLEASPPHHLGKVSAELLQQRSISKVLCCRLPQHPVGTKNSAGHEVAHIKPITSP